jgi:hypothetical protein
VAAEARDLLHGCAWCSRVARDLLEDGDDLVCRPGTGCARATPTRHVAVTHTRLVAPALTLVPTERPSDECACGEAAEWQELRGARLVGCCSVCEPGGPCR